MATKNQQMALCHQIDITEHALAIAREFGDYESARIWKEELDRLKAMNAEEETVNLHLH